MAVKKSCLSPMAQSPSVPVISLLDINPVCAAQI